MSSTPHAAHWLMIDEFTAILDRTFAKVLAFSLSKLVRRHRLGVIAATTHQDIATDFAPDLWLHCHGEGKIDIRRLHHSTPRRISFATELSIEPGSLADWPAFAKWHYRSHDLAFVRAVWLLKHHDQPIGICIFAAPAANLRLRSQAFGLTGSRSRTKMHALNEQLWLLQRVVLHPTYRGAGIAAEFIRQACSRCPIPWIETLSAMGQINPVFERAGFRKLGPIRQAANQHKMNRRGAYSQELSAESLRKSRFASPVYFLLDNSHSRPNEHRVDASKTMIFD